MKHRILSALAGVMLFVTPASAQNAGPQSPEGNPLRKQLWLVPATGARMLHVNILRPAGDGPFPLAIMNHGSPPDASKRPTMEVPVFRFVSEWLVAHGYAVALPLRRGFGATGGSFEERNGPCSDPDFARAGREGARDIEATLNFMLQQPFVKKSNAIVLGQSAGGWATLALASKNPSAVSAYVNFSGGRGGRFKKQSNALCNRDALIAAAREFGRTARKPTLWIYTANDSFFAPEIASKLFETFRAAGGRAELVQLPAFGEDGHQLVSKRDGVALWAPHIERFLREMQ